MLAPTGVNFTKLIMFETPIFSDFYHFGVQTATFWCLKHRIYYEIENCILVFGAPKFDVPNTKIGA